MFKIAVTGHRPSKLGGYTNSDWHRAIRRDMRDFLRQKATAIGDMELISGGALGIDQMWIEVGHYLEIPVIAAIPFRGFGSQWPQSSQQKLRELLDKCANVVYTKEEYGYGVYQRRNEWMVDGCDELRAYWSGALGGTANCIQYANFVHCPITIVNPDDLKL